MSNNKVLTFRSGILFIVKIIIVTLMALMFVFVLKNYYKEVDYYFKGYVVFGFLYYVIYAAFSSIYGCFKTGKQRIRTISFSHMLTIIFTNSIVYIIICLIATQMLNLIPILILSAAQTIACVFLSFFANKIYTILYPARGSFLICTEKEEALIFNKFKRVKAQYRIIETCHTSEGAETLKKRMEDYRVVIIGDVENSLRAEIITYCFEKNKRLFIMPTIQDIMLRNSIQTQIGDTMVYLMKNKSNAFAFEQLLIKRVIDVVVSVFGIVITSPIMLITALAIKINDRGPILYKQDRYTRDNKIFTLIKFRSMVVDAEKEGAQFSTVGDERITRVGNFIRKSRIDELPQLFNILKGDMTLVGPRPERIENQDAYTAIMPQFQYRSKVKAGLTGYAQIYGKYNTNFEDKVKMDLYYIENSSLIMDIKLLIYTLKVLFMKESTEGFKEKKLSELKKKKKKDPG